MSAPKPVEVQLLEPAEDAITRALSTVSESLKSEARYQLLEAVAAEFAGFDLSIFREIFTSEPIFTPEELRASAQNVLQEIEKGPIPVPLALSSLSRPELTRHEKRKGGAYYTDFRLAQFLATRLPKAHKNDSKLVDPAAGSGILLVATVLSQFPKPGKARDAFLARSVFAADLSALALRGALLSLSSLASSSEVVLRLSEHLRCADSLELKKGLWADVAPQGFDFVVGNPPWEKLKVTAHEVLQENGVSRHYGQGYKALSEFKKPIAEAKSVRQDYVAKISSQYFFQGDGEPDLYKYFLELSVELCRPGGHLALLIPGGLIRSQGTQALRKLLSESCSEVAYTILDNKSRFFAIDTRFKFLLVEAATADQEAPAEIRISHAKGTQLGVESTVAAKFPAEDLARVRPDLSVPEVRSNSEWTLFRKLARAHPRFGSDSAGWNPHFCREVDMSRDKGNFVQAAAKGHLPLIEGRMVHQFHHATKAYVSGQGRSAEWRSTYFEPKRELGPQFRYPVSMLTPAVRERTKVHRVGFCDITGQTNERSMLAAWIPPNVVCGNKVPTILFGNEERTKLLGNAWLGIANSFTFDWLLRRVLTTTVNYFLLLDLPIPAADGNHSQLKDLAKIASELSLTSPAKGWDYAELRAEKDILAASLYGLDPEDLLLVLQDFPLLDRAQPPLPGEARSTITRDYLVSAFAKKARLKLGGEFRERAAEAKRRGAIPYMPSHLDGDSEADVG